MSKRGLKRRQFDQAVDLTEASTKNYFIFLFPNSLIPPNTRP